MTKPSWYHRPFGTVELIAVMALVALALTYFRPIFERKMMRPVEIAALVRCEPTEKLAYGTPPPAVIPREDGTSSDYIRSLGGIRAIQDQAIFKDRYRRPTEDELKGWIDQRLAIRQIKNTSLIRYSCVVEDPVRDVAILGAVASAAMDQLNQSRAGRATLADPPQAPKTWPVSFRRRLAYDAGFLTLALGVSFAVVKLAQIRDGRVRFAI